MDAHDLLLVFPLEPNTKEERDEKEKKEEREKRRGGRKMTEADLFWWSVRQGMWITKSVNGGV